MDSTEQNTALEDHKLQLNKNLEEFKLSLNKALEEFKLELNTKFELKKLNHEKIMVNWRHIFEYAQIAIRSVILANGAGVTALITLLGVVQKQQDGKININRLGLGLAVGTFAIGVFSGVLATGFAYFSQHRIACHAMLDGEILIAATWQRIAGITFAFIGLAAFVAGVSIAVYSYLVP